MYDLGYDIQEDDFRLRDCRVFKSGILDVYQGPLDFEYIFSEKMHYYRILGVSKDANQDEIKRAFR